ncbi:glycosyltransferase family 2 protein [Psychrobacter immobilis]|uniref:glycosyltransferase family 2 protein n=1 Tax=Psychrobacter immobilis TaxID=498 RepID=UPI00191AD28A|nr:glycosyltransferase family 2 protein [Psychrobacter immobilis]
MEKYDVSIIVPVYNREKIIIPCIESINAQTYNKSKWEVIFVDDASTDNSIRTIESLIDKSINYRILRRPIGSGNASAPRNEGIKASTAKYVFFLDSDDYIDSQLLENGMAIALKNDSDMVYVKLGGARGTNKRSFRKAFVDNADILNHHLMRSLKIFKFHKNLMLKENKILFNPNIDVFEDMLFSCTCLAFSEKYSILADKEYYFLESHDDGHLSHVKMNLSTVMDMFISGLNSIIFSSNSNKSKLYNAWVVKIVERFRVVCKKNSINNEECIEMFKLTSSYFGIHKDFFDLSQIYENEKMLTLLFLAGDFREFHKISNESKLLKNLQVTFQEKLKQEVGFSKAWIFKNKIQVIDFDLKRNKIAFDIEVNEKKNSLHVWVLSRNNPDSLEFLRKNAIKVEGKKLLIFDGMLNEKNKVIALIKEYVIQISNS